MTNEEESKVVGAIVDLNDRVRGKRAHIAELHSEIVELLARRDRLVRRLEEEDSVK